MTRIHRGRALGYASFYARKALPDGSPPAKGRSKLVRMGVLCVCACVHAAAPHQGHAEKAHQG